jgi:hypothetical protein
MPVLRRLLVIPQLMVGPSKIGPDSYTKFFCTIYIVTAS